ncbi:MAG: efflux RND transporter periplasmic adaptor subunit [Bacteroidetes bacterium]|nr:efflux RND transporter periplasmic adaptor subunit [Bacteroidota bacterium]
MFNSKFKIVILFSLVIIGSILFTNCSDEEKVESKSMTQIQTEEGIPVSLQKITEQNYSKDLKFFGTVRGIRESIEGAAIGGRIEKINYKVGDRVKKGDVVIEFPQDAPGSMYQQAKSAYENSSKNYERVKALLAAGETSQASFDGIQTQYLVDKRNYETQKQMLFIEAPYDGVITGFMVNEKNNVASKDPLFSIAQLNKVRVRVHATEDEINEIKKGMKASLMNNDKEVLGKVVEISINADPRTQSFYAEAEFDNSNYTLKTGVTVDVKINVYSNSKAIVVPRNLIKEDKGGKYVFVNQNGNASQRYIKTGKESDIYVEVTDGLIAADYLIVKGASRLNNGTKLNVIQ